MNALRRRWFTVSIALLTATAAAAQPASPPTVTLLPFGRVTLTLPAPAGFVEVRAGSEEFQKRFASTDTQDSLAVHLPKETAAAYQSGQMLTFYTLVRVLRELRAVDISAADFEDLAEQMASKKLMASKEFQDFLAKEKQQGSPVGQPVDLGLLERTPNSVSVMALLPVSAGDKQATLVGVNSSVFVRNRLLYLYMYRVLESPADFKIVQDAAIDWVARTVAANR
jgi:hypothetical protein